MYKIDHNGRLTPDNTYKPLKLADVFDSAAFIPTTSGQPLLALGDQKVNLYEYKREEEKWRHINFWSESQSNSRIKKITNFDNRVIYGLKSKIVATHLEAQDNSVFYKMGTTSLVRNICVTNTHILGSHDKQVTLFDRNNSLKLASFNTGLTIGIGLSEQGLAFATDKMLSFYDIRKTHKPTWNFNIADFGTGTSMVVLDDMALIALKEKKYFIRILYKDIN